MELKQVKALLHQTECGEMFMDGMGVFGTNSHTRKRWLD